MLTRNLYRPIAAALLAVFLLGASGLPLSVAYCSMDAEPESCCCGAGCCAPDGDSPVSPGGLSSERTLTNDGFCCVAVTVETDAPLSEVVLATQGSKGDAGIAGASTAVRVTEPSEDRHGSKFLIPPEPLTPFALRTRLFTSSFLI